MKIVNFQQYLTEDRTDWLYNHYLLKHKQMAGGNWGLRPLRKDEFVQLIKEFDPTPNMKYFQWVLNTLNRFDIRHLEDAAEDIGPKYRQNLAIFDKFKNKFSSSDINSYKGVSGNIKFHQEAEKLLPDMILSNRQTEKLDKKSGRSSTKRYFIFNSKAIYFAISREIFQRNDGTSDSTTACDYMPDGKNSNGLIMVVTKKDKHRYLWSYDFVICQRDDQSNTSSQGLKNTNYLLSQITNPTKSLVEKMMMGIVESENIDAGDDYELKSVINVMVYCLTHSSIVDKRTLQYFYESIDYWGMVSSEIRSGVGRFIKRNRAALESKIKLPQHIVKTFISKTED